MNPSQRRLELEMFLGGSALSNLRLGPRDPITATKITRDQELMSNPDHPLYPQWAKERDAELQALQELWLRPVINRTFDLMVEIGAFAPTDPSQCAGYWKGTGRHFIRFYRPGEPPPPMKPVYRWVWLYVPRT